MKKRVMALIMVAALLIGSSSTFAYEVSEDRASHFFDSYLLGVSPQGNSRMLVTFSVWGMGKMDQIGAYSIRIEEEAAKDVWFTVLTRYGSEAPSEFYSYNTYDHWGQFYFVGVPGVRYRAVMVAYAKNDSGYEYSEEIECTPKTCT